MARVITEYNWTPGVFEKGYRKTANFLHADFVGLDFDSGDFTLEDARDVWDGCSHIIGTTSSHTEGLHKFRVILTLEERITSTEDYKATARGLAVKYGGDTSCGEPSRFFYPCKELVRVMSGDRLEIIQAENEVNKFPVRERNTRVIPSYVMRQLSHEVIPIGKRNAWCYGVGKDLGLAGFSIDEILVRVIASPTYKDGSPPVREIARAVTSGFKSSLKGAASGEEKETE